MNLSEREILDLQEKVYIKSIKDDGTFEIKRGEAAYFVVSGFSVSVAALPASFSP